MKRLLLPVLVALIFMPAAFADVEQPSKGGPLTVEIVVNRYKPVEYSPDENHEWDRGVGANPAPDVYGKIELPDNDCEIPVHEDSYVVKQDCTTSDMRVGTPVNVQLYDRDHMRLDDKIAIGTMRYQGNPTEATIGSAKVKVWYTPNQSEDK